MGLSRCAVTGYVAPLPFSESPPAVFVLGAPRTGSTIMYQVLASAFRLPFLSNAINDRSSDAPADGLALEHAAADRRRILGVSRFGKTEGPNQPSEASRVMQRWFGGGHPSQVVSADLLPGQEEDLVRTMVSAFTLYGRPLVIKNPWNCFRVSAIARALPNARFVWIRRDISAAAKSDLHARYVIGRSPMAWSSATPHNVESLRSRPYWVQVVENQFEFSVALERALNADAAGRFLEVWYEDLCAEPIATIWRLANEWPVLGAAVGPSDGWADVRPVSEQWDLSEDDVTRIDTYVRSGGRRLGGLCYHKALSSMRRGGIGR